MISLSGLLTAVAAKLSAISAVTTLAPTVTAYIDSVPTNNSLGQAVYQMTTGEVLIAWTSTNIADDGYQWRHNISIFAKAAESQSSLALLNAIVDGKATGDGNIPWRLTELLPGLTVGDVDEINRITDSQSIDHFEIKVSLLEIGDTF